MLRAITSFRGEAPRVTPRALPDNAAQEAVNASLLTGDLRAFRQFATTIGLTNVGLVRTIFKLNGAWLSWTADVDVARGAISGDTTFRTYLTSPDFYAEPRFTNYALATTGSPPYPVTTRPLGVPAPDSVPSLVVGVGNVPTTDVTDSGDQLASSWVTSTTVPGVSQVSQDAAVGNPAPSYKLLNANNVASGAFAYRDFGIETSVVVEYTSQFAPVSNGSVLEAAWRVMATEAGAGAVVKVGYPAGASGGLFLQIGAVASWGGTGSWFTQIPMSALDGSGATWYDMVITATQNDSGTTTITAKVYNGSGLLAEAEVTSVFTIGGYCGVEMVTSFTPAFYTHYDNFHIVANGSTTSVVTSATSYVFTFVNDLGEESAPSLPSATILRPDGVSVTVTTPVAVQSGVSSDYGITTKRIYRAATGNTGTVFRFVAEIPLATADYVDVLTDAELGEVLQSDLWALPPDDLEGILALPNGVMAGFSKNQLCLSAQNHPHAWPVEYRLNTDTDIIGIGNIDTTVVIGTESFVYVASGNDPAAYSMSKFEVPYACVSKKSFAYLTGIGVVFAGPDGLMAVAGPGQVRNLTDTVFTRDQWQALNPESIFGVAHNDIYWMFWESGSRRGCYGIDMKATGFGVVQMAFHASAAYVDPVEDKMYLVLDHDDEPDDPSLPVPAEPPHYIDGMTIFEFEGNPSVLMTYRYLSKLWLLPSATWMSIAQVRAEDYDNILFRLYGDDVLIDEIQVTEETEFTLSDADAYDRLQFEILGTSPVRIVQAAEDVGELG